MSRNASIDRSIISGTATLLVLSIVAIILAIGHMGNTPVSMGVHHYLVEWCQAGQNVNYLSQREAHTTLLISCTLLIFMGSKLAKRAANLSCPAPLALLSFILLVGFCLTSMFWWVGQPVSKPAWTIVAIVVVALTFASRWLPKALIVVPASIALLAVIPGLLIAYDASWMTPNAFIEFQQGYSVVSSQCDRISMGHHIFEAVKPNYGILAQVLCGLWEKHNGIFTLGDNIQIIRWMQAFTVVFAFVVYAWYARRSPFPTILGLMLMLPWLHSNQLSLLFPNLSPWRSFGFPLAAISLVICMRIPEKAKYICLGSIAGICLTLNLETGIAILIGFLSFTYFSHHQAENLLPPGFIKSVLQCLFGASVWLVLFYLFIAISLGYFPNLQSYLQHLQTLQYMTKTGYAGGFKLNYSPIPTFFLCHYTYVLFRASLSTVPLTQRECFRAFAATTALVWSVYYFNRPHEWYLQPQYFFYAILLIDMARVAQSRAWTWKTVDGRAAAIACLIAVLVPQMVLATQTAWPSYHAMLRQLRKGTLGNKDAKLISGIYVHPDAAKDLRHKAKVLLEENRQRKVLYLTGNTVLIPKLTKLYLKTDFDDPYMELTYTKSTDAFIEQIKNSAVNEVLIDSKDGYLAGDRFRHACWQNIETKLAPQFQFAEIRGGWRILVRSAPVTKATNEIGLDQAKN